MSHPTEEKIQQIKSQFPDRVLLSVDAVDGEEQIQTFIMTGPSREEYRFFVEKMMKAREIKDEAERIFATRSAVENAALAQIRWPEREEVRSIFDARPEMVDNFAAEIQKAAGGNVEFRSKKL